MKNRLFLIFMLTFQILSLFSNLKPDWITNRPINNDYFYGIAMILKKDNPDYLVKAKTAALNDLSSEIKVSLKSSLETQITQQNNNFDKKYNKNTVMSSEALFEGFELVDTWEDKKEYWVYYKLSKKIYDLNRYRKVRNAISSGEDLFRRANGLEMDGNLIAAMKLKYQAIFGLNSFINNDLLELNNGRESDLINRWTTLIQESWNSIKIVSEQKELITTSGSFLPSYIINVSWNQTPIKDLPLISGTKETDQWTKVRTDKNGNVNFTTSKVAAYNSEGIVITTIDPILFLIPDSLKPSLKKYVESIILPSSNIQLRVNPMRIALEISENIGSKNSSTQILTNKIRNTLLQNNFIIVTDSSFQYKIVINSDSRDTDQLVRNKICSILITSIKVFNKDEKEPIFGFFTSPIKGYDQNSSENAALEAYATALKAIDNSVFSPLFKTLLNGRYPK